jgi:RimJ/RimL family protein N-acetyltransferase
MLARWSETDDPRRVRSRRNIHNGAVLELRAARPEDEELVLIWRNEVSTRAGSFSSEEISRDEHSRWFARKLADSNCKLLIVEEDGRPVGQVRLDRVEADKAEISIGLAPDARGRGVGREALRCAVLEAPRRLGVTTVTAFVKHNNAASLAAFTAAGFRVIGESDDVVELLIAPDVDSSTG